MLNRIEAKKYKYTMRKMTYNMNIVHFNPSLPFPGDPRAHAQKTCHSPLRKGGNPEVGIASTMSGGRVPGGIRLVTELMLGTTTPGCVRKVTRNVPAYP